MLSTILVSVETTLLLSIAALYIVHCPFNKVEESFNTQAVHDIVNIFPNYLPSIDYNGTSTTSVVGPVDDNLRQLQLSYKEIAIRSHLPWDHTQYPGVVPRTFVGALMVGLPLRLARQFILNGFFDDDVHVKDDHDFTAQFILQIGSRFALSSFVAISMSTLLRAIQRRYGLAYRLSFLIITISQFHYIFYAGRFLPNTFAAILSNLVFASWINRQYSKSIIYIALCVVIFRFDTSIFYGLLILDGIFIRRFLSLTKVLKVGIPAGIVAIAITVIVDSIFWARPVWPELEGFYFNVWLNKSHEWGTQPYFWYIYSCIPRIMLSSSVLLLVADHKFTRDYFIPVLAFIFTYSILPHKELRFILFITPLLNLCAASGLMNVYYYLNKLFLYLNSKIQPPKNSSAAAAKSTKKKKLSDAASSDHGIRTSRIAKFLFTIVIAGMLISNLFACFILSRVSSHNYPGGQVAISLGVTKELLDAAKKSLDGMNDANLKDSRSDVAVYVNNLAAQTGVSRFVQVDGVYYAKNPKINSETFTKGYKLIYLILEPSEIPDFLRDHCPHDKNFGKVLENGAGWWRKTNDEIKCQIPNQPEMYCSIVDTINSFKSVNIGGLLRKLKQIRSIQALATAFGDNGFIKTRVALRIIRCSVRSKFNPFS